MTDERDPPEDSIEEPPAADEGAPPGTGDAATGPFDAAAAVAELEAAMAAADAAQGDAAKGPDRYIAILEDEVQQLSAQVAARDQELKEANLRAARAHEQITQARARLERESDARLEQRTRGVLQVFVEVLDDLERAIGAAREMDHNPEVVAGVELVQRRFLTALEGFGVAKQQALGTRFDPAQHEAVSMIPVQDPSQDGRVIAVTREGYTIGDGELLRPAAVVVGRAQPGTNDPPGA